MPVSKKVLDEIGAWGRKFRKSSQPRFSDLTDSQLSTWLARKAKENADPWEYIQRKFVGMSAGDILAIASDDAGASTTAQIAWNVVQIYELSPAAESTNSAKAEGMHQRLRKLKHGDGQIASGASKNQSGTARFVSWINGVTKAHEDADRAAAERAAQRMRKGPAPSSGPNAAASNQRPAQVDGSGRTTTPPKGGNGGVASPSAPTSHVGPFSGSNSAAANQRPDQVAANGRVSGDLEDPGIGAGRVTPITVASTADGGPAAIFDFFNRRKRNGSN
ncbi:hypothetical protein [Burkholderia cenocepacia]|uniref:hypothetical protein n=1 Tax=Burkholderia cenocepacia TaxID=95486 RepID=UPI002ABD3782|nr:hypothetical protein [Burkholderia cenocepacia]